MEKLRLTELEIEEIVKAFVEQEIEPPQKGELHYFSKIQASSYIRSYLKANQNGNYIYGLEGREAFAILRRENETLRFFDILRMIYNSYRTLGYTLLHRLQKLESNGELALEERYAIQKKKFIFVGMVVVKEEFQRKGYFRKLMEEIFEMAREENRMVVLNTDTNEKCQKYQHLGFQLKKSRVLEENNVRYDLDWSPETLQK
ncbi:MAG: GNAT family N-acetyltransferase [Firmicutes bacterium]|nr:GNAT family N-acetyltransferase [Bacillota bacterium]